MAESAQKLAASLEELRRLQVDGTRVFASHQLSRISRERLVKHGFLQEVMKGWLISASPAARPGDTTPWFASFWEFCQRYCEARFGDAWHLSPEQSLLLHGANTIIPRQVILHSPAAGNNRIDLRFGTSFFALRERAMPAARDLEVKHGLRLYRVEVALILVPESFFLQHPVEAQVVLGSIREPSALLARLLEGGHTVVAGRLSGAVRRLGRPELAEELVSTMRSADHAVRETDPFDPAQRAAPAPRAVPAIVARLHTMWAAAREPARAELSRLRRHRVSAKTALGRIDGVYQMDAYHSLSIEGYQVTPDLIARVAGGAWDPDRQAADRDDANALAARGYWLAFQRVRDTVRRILDGVGGVDLLRTAHREWYREMFSPHVAAGLLSPSLLAGYRSHPVYLRGSRHVPPRSELLHEAMPALFDLIEQEPAPFVKAVLGHWLLGYVHPFPDGNGRVARLVMNTLLVVHGYPWTVIRADDRMPYLSALEAASVDGDARPFAKFVATQMARTAMSGARRSVRRPARRRARGT